MSVPALWAEVNRYGQNGDFTRALKTVNKSERRAGGGGELAGPRPSSGARDHHHPRVETDPGLPPPGLEPRAAAGGRVGRPFPALALRRVPEL